MVCGRLSYLLYYTIDHGTTVEIWQPRCLELLGTNGTDAISVYASATRELPKSWRKEYFVSHYVPLPNVAGE